MGRPWGIIQNYHSKLWFAGIAENWELAEFYHHELEESFEMLEKYRSDKSYAQHIDMIYPSLKKLENSLKESNMKAFKADFREMTHTCNACHQTTDHAFMVIKEPEDNNFDNQVFKSE